MKIRAIIDRMLSMGDDAWFWLIRSIQLSCALVFCAWMLLLPESVPHSTYRAAMQMLEMPKAILLIGLLFSVCTEDIECNRKR